MSDTFSEIFTTLVQIPSPSGKEAKVADYLEKYFKELGWKTWRDASGKINESETGNLYCYLEVNKNLETFAFSAHMDTVQKEGDIVKVKFDGKTFRSDGTTILGADDKAGIAALVGAAKDLKKDKLKHNVLFFFPTREETGMMGSSLFNKKGIGKIKYFFNLDGGGTPGLFVYKALGFKNFLIKVKGKAAHAAKEYEKGKDAMKAAALLITLLPIGKDTKEGSTFNIGAIEGGSATNVVCDLVELKGELRGFREDTMARLKEVVLKKAKEVENKTGVKIEVIFDEKGAAPPLIGNSDNEICDLCKKVALKIGLKPSFSEAFYTCDGNFYSALGYATITVSRGGSDAHAKTESLLLADLEKTVELIKEINFNGASSF